MKKYKVFTINPGSTSTKIALFDGEEKIYSKNVSHDAKQLDTYATISEQFPYRRDMIFGLLAEDKVDMTNIDAVVGRGGGLLSMEGGTYAIDELILKHASEGANGVQHPAMLGPRLAYDFAKSYKVPSFVVNPPDVDELQDVARITGIKGVYRNVHLHALNLKETGIKYAAENGKNYEECYLIICHIGGGISISAHSKGKMIDGFDIVGGEGPMAPTRCGSVSVSDLLKYANGKDVSEVKKLCTRSGGFVSHLNTSDAIKVVEQADSGDKYSQLIWDAMIYQIEKCIGSMAVVLGGKAEAILLSGGMARDKDLVEKITDTCDWIAPIKVYPGEFEMEAMASGAVRVLDDQEDAKVYTGESKFQGFEF
ncbi:MAG: butyrate kinase [Suipraeoptans sp.]